MMSLITHHLTPEGEERFSGWFSRLRAALTTQPGFVSVRAFTDATLPNARHVLLEMQSETALFGWTSGDDKAPLLREIEALAAKPWTALRLRPL
jgi:antibiotic biosynthesis monooxygenase (ABM) superfamily enzyme